MKAAIWAALGLVPICDSFTTFTLRPLANADLVLGPPNQFGSGGGLDFQNGEHVTHMLVTNFYGIPGQDVDENNNGLIDPGPPWDSVVDAIGLIKVEQDWPIPPEGEGWAYGEILGFDSWPPREPSARITLPGFNDLHHCLPWQGGLAVANTGLECVDSIDFDGGLRERWDLLAGQPGAREIDPERDYRRVTDTKPHRRDMRRCSSFRSIPIRCKAAM